MQQFKVEDHPSEGESIGQAHDRFSIRRSNRDAGEVEGVTADVDGVRAAPLSDYPSGNAEIVHVAFDLHADDVVTVRADPTTDANAADPPVRFDAQGDRL